jgi:hypothetical protein
MSVNLRFSVTIRGYRDSQLESIRQAVQTVFEEEEIDDVMPPLTECTDVTGRLLTCQSEEAVIISGGYRWLPEVQSTMSARVTEANQGACEVAFEGIYEEEADGDDEETELEAEDA